MSPLLGTQESVWPFYLLHKHSRTQPAMHDTLPCQVLLHAPRGPRLPASLSRRPHS